MSAVLKWTTLGALLWAAAMAVYDLPLRKLDAAVLKPVPLVAS